MLCPCTIFRILPFSFYLQGFIIFKPNALVNSTFSLLHFASLQKVESELTDPLASIFFEPTLKLVQRRRRTETLGKFLVTVVVLWLALGSHPQTLHLLQRKLSELHQILSYLIASSRASKGTWHVTDDHRAKWPKEGQSWKSQQHSFLSTSNFIVH